MKNWVKIVLRRILPAFVITMLLLLIAPFLPALWRYLVVYPRLERQAAQLASAAHPVSRPQGFQLRDYKGAMHVHSYWSHDSRGTLGELLPAAQKAGLDFIFFSDHPRERIDRFPRSYFGMHGGVLCIPGSEKRGLLVWPLRNGSIDWQAKTSSIIASVLQQGGLVFYAHSEDRHAWRDSLYLGMEIYNIHTDVMDESLAALLPNFIINSGRYHRWIYREIYDEQHEILARWDSLNTWRRIVGIAGNDAHENQNLRARFLEDGRLEWVGPNADPIDTTQVRFWMRPFLHAPDSAGWVLRWELDPYEQSLQFVNTHILADSLTPQALAAHLRRGHVYVAFDGIAEARGFLFYGANAAGELTAVMGDSVQHAGVAALRVVAPIAGRIRLLRDGEILLERADSATARFSLPTDPAAGAYRVEVALRLDGRWVPWIYSNPIYVAEK